jgi:heme-degrading monooxygenase HmoA
MAQVLFAARLPTRCVQSSGTIFQAFFEVNTMDGVTVNAGACNPGIRRLPLSSRRGYPMTDTSENRHRRFAATPEPPYYIVAFSSIRTEGDKGYGAMADRMEQLALEQPGCLGVESARDPDGFGITNSFWRDEESIRAWKAVVAHLAAQKMGRERWYERYHLRIAKVERAYGFTRTDES